MAGKEGMSAGNVAGVVRRKTSEAQSSVASCIDVVFIPEMATYVDFSGKIALVVDILRASSTITMALTNGARAVLPVLTPEDAFTEYQDEYSLLCGERHGKRIKGFHLGNSPREYHPEIVRDKQLIFTTTNGTRALHVCSNAAELLMGSFLNRRAVCDHLVQSISTPTPKRNIVIVCSGKEGNIGIEDLVFAGLCVDTLKSRIDVELTDAAKIARLIYEHYSTDILGMLFDCEHGKYLASIGLAEDLEFCAQMDVTDVVPIGCEGKLVKAIQG
ncbi:2-phosphosulfolactate phosphatase [bacterium]|nr:2-phosphosulfolactate phosphatase [bacterium]